MHRWVDMSEADFGVALINDCKYGYDALEQQVRLTLVRGPSYPSPDADRGEHRLRYGLLVHGGLADLGEVHRAAERFNNPVAVFGTPQIAQAETEALTRFSLVTIEADTVTIETVKKAEDSDALVLRLFEHGNRRGPARLRFGVPVRSVRQVNLMEEDAEAPIPLSDNGVSLNLRPFEIVTLLVELEPGAALRP